MGVQPAGNAGQQGGDQEDDDLLARGVDAHRPAITVMTALEARMARQLAGVEQVADADDGEQDDSQIR